MTQEEKAKRYDETLEKIKNLVSCGLIYEDVAIQVFPELKESKDEKIRKVIYGWIYTQPSQFFDSGFSKEEMLTWLEKQGNPTEDELEALRMAAYEPTKNWSEKLQSLYEKLTHCEQKPVFEMKTPEESLGIDSDTYNKIVDECIYGEQKHTNKSEPTDYNSIDPHFFKTTDKVEPKFKVGDYIEPIDSCLGSPRTIYKICDGWYETNQGTLDFEFENNWRLVEQKLAWTEEDEVKINRIVACLENLNVADNDILLKDVDWLKSLRSQNTWKPNDEQINALDSTLQYSQVSHNSFEHLNSLFNDLNKLREE